VKKPQYYSMLRTSVVPTMLQAGIKENVIPPTAEATLDIRALPDEDLPKFREMLAGVVNDSQVKVAASTRPTPCRLPGEQAALPDVRSSRTRPKTGRPGCDHAPVMTTGATDSSFLRTKGVQAYGIGVPKTEEESRTVHGNDEHIEIKQLGLFVRYVLAAVTEVAAQKP